MMHMVPSFLRRAAYQWHVLGLLLLLASSTGWAQTNDDCASVVPVTVSANCAIPVNGTVAGATQSLAPTAACGFNITTANDVWYSFVATGVSQLITLAPRFAAIMDVRSGTCASSTSVFCAAVANGNTNPTSVGGLTVGDTYLLRIYASGNTPPAGISSTFALCIAPGASTSVPVNDECAGAIDVPVQAGGVCVAQVAGDNTGATASAGVPAPGCAQYVGSDIWFKVTVPASGSVTVQTVTPASGSPVSDTGLGIYSGTCGNLSLLGCDDDGTTTSTFSLLTVTGRTPGEVLFVRVWEFGGNAFGPIALCAVTFSPPTNDECAGAIAVPVSATCTPVSGTLGGATQSLAPAATCGTLATITDVWYRFTATAATQTVTLTGNFQAVIDVRIGTCASSSSVYCGIGIGPQPRIISGLTVGQQYYLRVYASGVQPALGASGFTLCLGPPPVAPANDECAAAVAIPVTTACTTPTSGTIANASQSLAPTATCGAGLAANDVWYSFVASGVTQSVTFTGAFGAIIDVRSGSCASSASVYCSNAFNGQALTVTGLSSGQAYYLRLYVNGTVVPINPTFTLCINPGPTPPTNDECAGAVAVPVTTTCAVPTSGSYAAASQSVVPTTGCGAATIARDVWYSFVANGSTQTVTVTSTFGTVIDVRTGSCAASTSVFCTTTFTGQGTVVTGLTSGQAYYLRLYPNTNIQPTVLQSALTLCITAGPLPSANDECATAVPVAVVQSCATSTNGTVSGATQSLPPTAACGTNVTTAADVWYSFVAASPSQLITLTSRFNAVMEVRAGTCGSTTSVFCNTIFANAAAGTVVGGLTSGQTYYLRIYANGATQPTPTNATFTICINPAPTPPVNDECAGAIAVPVTTACTAPTSGTVEAASQSLAPTTTCGVATLAQDVWYSFVATNAVQLLTLTSRFPAVLDVRSGTCGSTTSVFCTMVGANDLAGTAVSSLTVGQTYYLRVYANGLVQPAPINATFTLCVTPAPTPPANDECAGAVPLTVGATCVPTTGTLAAATQSIPATATCNFGGNTANDVWYSFVATASAQAITVGTPLAAVIDVRSGTCASSTSVFCGFVRSTTPVMQLVGGLTAGQTYYLRVYSVDLTPPTGAAAVLTICVSTPPTPPVNDDCAGAIDVPVQFGSVCTTSVTGSNAAATASAGVPAPGCAGYQGGDIWFKATVPASGILTVQTVQAATSDVGDTGLAIYSGTCGNLALVDCDDDSAPNTKSIIYLTGRTPGEVVYIRAWRFANNFVGNIAVCVTAPIPTCAEPTGLAAANLTITTADVSWLAGGTPAAGTTYQVSYGPPGFNPNSSGTTITNIASPSTAITNLIPGTAYCFYVQQVCPGTAGISLWVGPQCFTTVAAPVCPMPINLTATNVTASSATLNWQPGSGTAAGISYSVTYTEQSATPGLSLTFNTPALSVPIVGLTPGAQYCFTVTQNCGTSGNSAVAGPVCFTMGSGPANDEPCGAVAFSLTTLTPLVAINGTNAGATTSTQPGIGAPTCATNATPQDVWFSFVPQTGAVHLVFSGTAAGLVRVFTTADCTAGPFVQVACAASGASNTGVTNVNVTNVTPGELYYVAVSGYGPNDTPGAFTIAGENVILATRAHADTDALQVYPNPSNSGQVTLRLKSLRTTGEATLLNALGQSVLQATVPAGTSEHTLHTRGLATGIYTLRVVVGTEVLTRKVVLD
jgi:hypothetical protein